MFMGYRDFHWDKYKPMTWVLHVRRLKETRYFYRSFFGLHCKCNRNGACSLSVQLTLNMLHNTWHYMYISHNALWEISVQGWLIWMYTGDTSGIRRRSGYFQHTVNLAFGLDRAYYILAKLVSTADKVGGLEYSFRPFYYSHIDKGKRSFTRAASGIFGSEWNRTLVCINGNTQVIATITKVTPNSTVTDCTINGG